jgi:lipopolysaccharide export system protein LptA
MSNWRGRVRVGLGIFMVAFAALVYNGIRQREEPVAATPSAPAAPGVVVESSGAKVTRFKLSRQDVAVESARQLTFADGSTKLETVTVHVSEREGRTFQLAAAEATIGPNQSTFEVRGRVKMEASDGLAVLADHASFDAQEAILRVPGKVRFTRGQLSGTSLGATYDRNRDVLWLLDKADVKVAGEGDALPIQVHSGSAELARRDNFMRFDRGARMLRDGRLIEADTATATFRPGAQTLELVELRGGARITGGTAGSGGLRVMRANDMNLSYAEDGRSLSRALLLGTSSIEIAGAADQADRRLAADWIDVRLAPDGNTVTELAARDKVELRLPGEGATPTRRIRSTRLTATGAAGTGLTAAKFIDEVDYREGAASPVRGAANDRTMSARLLELDLKSGFSSIDEARFTGDVAFSQGSTKAASAAARYLVPKGEVELSMLDDQSPRPRVTDQRAAIEARTIAITLEGPAIAADSDVRSELTSEGNGRKSAEPANRLPALLSEGQPAFVTAQHLKYDSAAGSAEYTGGARLWQGDTAIQADSLTLNIRSGSLSARGSARSTFAMSAAEEKSATAEQVPTIGRADELAYDDARRRVTYDTKAHVRGPQGDLTADRIELYLGAKASDLERVEAYDTVTLTLDTRSATGARLTYFAAEGRYLMTGTPVRIVKECLVTTGQILTFFGSTDTITVDGTEERTQTRGVNCPEKSGS